MFERKMIQTSVEPTENKSFSSVDVNCTICELAVWHNFLNELAHRRQTDILNLSASGIIFTYNFFELV